MYNNDYYLPLDEAVAAARMGKSVAVICPNMVSKHYMSDEIRSKHLNAYEEQDLRGSKFQFFDGNLRIISGSSDSEVHGSKVFNHWSGIYNGYIVRRIEALNA